jgi:hypothetical protein
MSEAVQTVWLSKLLTTVNTDTRMIAFIVRSTDESCQAFQEGANPLLSERRFRRI